MCALLLHGNYIASRRLLWSYRVTVSAHTAAELLPSLVRRPRTLSRIISDSGHYYRQLQALVENVFVLSVSVQLAH